MTPEGKLKKEMRNWLEVNGIYYANVAGGAFSKPGDPDLIVVVNGRALGVEAKSKTGQQKELQHIRQEQLEAAGGSYIVARSMDDLVAAVTRLKTL